MNVQEAAAELKVSPRRVRAMIADGRISAHKQGKAWVIDEIKAPKTRRPLSPRSWGHLANALKLRTLEGLTGHERSRTAARIKMLREAEHPSKLLLELRPENAPESLFIKSLVAHALLGRGDYLKLSLERPPEYLRKSEDLAQVVATERAIRGIDRKTLAASAEVTEAFVKEIETAKPLTTPGALRRVLRVLDIEPTALPNMVLE